MASAQRAAVPLRRGSEGDSPTTDLSDLLQTSPCDALDAARELVARVGRVLGTPASAAACGDDGRWTVLAGPRDPGDLEPRAAEARGQVVAPDRTVALLWDPAGGDEVDAGPLLRHACVWLALVCRAAATTVPAGTAAEESTAIREVVQQLLSARDADQVLTAIAERTLPLLDSDICGVMLLEGDVVRMRACVGNRVAETARLEMHRGQGLAGRVFDTGRPGKVDSYLEDRTISADFMSLAEKEETRSALAVPLNLQGEFIGVLEVWRRRPSTFTQDDVRRMVTLADVATVAIDNARLHDRQAAATAEAEQARDALTEQVAVLDRSSRLQQSLLTTVIEGGGLPAVARAVADELACGIGVYGPDGNLMIGNGPDGAEYSLPRTLPPVSRRRAARQTGPYRWIRPVYADGDQVGQVVLDPAGHSAELMEAVAGQVAMACSLALLRERAASRARAQAAEQVLWDLLQGPVEHRIAARGRAQQFGITLAGPLRVLHGRMENVEELAAEHGWDTSQTDRVRRDALRTVRLLDEGRKLPLNSLRGDAIVAVSAELDRSAAKDLAGAVSAAVHRDHSGLRLTWGISREHGSVMELPNAMNEASTALAAARRLGGRNTYLYEELGIVRLLLGSGNDPDLQTFIEDVTGPLIAYDKNNDGALIRTLRAFFDADCSQRVAAERLYVHHKTLRYRLERIRQLTGLDLSRHEDRMRADFALRLLEINHSGDDASGETVGS
jgi:sugar diacid utilization regulator/putative methionine-R-sulfoxide reductase with GAF domain